jgi:hypothetical protein
MESDQRQQKNPRIPYCYCSMALWQQLVSHEKVAFEH